MMRWGRVASAALTALAVSACTAIAPAPTSTTEATLPAPTASPEAVPPDLSYATSLRAPAEDSIVVAGRTFVLETYLNRDFMPMSPPNPSLLTAFVRVTATDRREFPAWLDVAWLAVLRGDDVWMAAEIGKRRPADSASPHQLGVIAGGGPAWEVGALVDVIVQVRDSAGNVYHLKAVGQPIRSSS